MDSDYSEIVPKLLRSYQEIGGLNKTSTNLPSRRAVARICEDLLTLLFPGFFDEGAVPESELEMLTTERVAAMSRELHRQIGKALRCRGEAEDDCFRKVNSLVRRFLHCLHRVRSILRTDVEAAYEGDPAAKSIEEIILAYPFIEAVAIQRLAHVLYRQDVPIIPRMMTEWAHSTTGIDIHPGAKIGTHFFIDHGTGVVIGETCVIGNRVKLYDGVTLGARSFPRDKDGRIVKGSKRHPNVEDDVTIYANATILGGETVIGANSTIGANAFILNSVPPNSLVALGELEHRILDKSQRAASPAKPSLSPVDTVRKYPSSGSDSDLTEMTRSLLLKVGLSDLASRVSVVWNRRLTSTAGHANYQTSEISINPLLQDISEAEIDRTVRHELAHLIAYARAKGRKIGAHGAEWRRACADIGIPGEKRCHNLSLPTRRLKPAHAYQCPSCRKAILRVRPLRAHSGCFRCCKEFNKGRYDDRFAYRRISLELGIRLADRR